MPTARRLPTPEPMAARAQLPTVRCGWPGGTSRRPDRRRRRRATHPDGAAALRRSPALLAPDYRRPCTAALPAGGRPRTRSRGAEAAHRCARCERTTTCEDHPTSVRGVPPPRPSTAPTPPPVDPARARAGRSVLDGLRFGRYYGEILRAEGLNEFAIPTSRDVSAATLAAPTTSSCSRRRAAHGRPGGDARDWVARRRQPDRHAPRRRLAGLLGLERRRRRPSATRYLEGRHVSGAGRRHHQPDDPVPREPPTSTPSPERARSLRSTATRTPPRPTRP